MAHTALDDEAVTEALAFGWASGRLRNRHFIQRLEGETPYHLRGHRAVLAAGPVQRRPTVYIVDRRQTETETGTGDGPEPVPIEVSGHIFVAGGGVAQGYFSRGGLIDAAFVPGTSFSEASPPPADAVLNNGYYISHMRLCARIFRLSLPRRFPVQYVSNDKVAIYDGADASPPLGSWTAGPKKYRARGALAVDVGTVIGATIAGTDMGKEKTAGDLWR
ncbi:lovastatin nonaketide synthase [Colletotrichum tabaci]|uniref:Lovastatin nonaketide synthase n=1 Tax=Colletotrichum tabaci TaxID=1209068 RepID=A0AAV9T467_9PEZI